MFFISTLLLSASVFSQDDKVYGPEAEDWALSIDATPFLNYFGNFIGGEDANAAPTWDFLTTNQQITGKYFVSSDMAYRGSLRLGFASNSVVNNVLNRSIDPSDFPDYPNLPEQVENKMSMTMTNIGLSGGVEWRKGEGRLQGYYGAELGVSFSTQSVKYEYGNELTLPDDNNPVSVDPDDEFAGADNVDTDPFGNPSRVLESKSGGIFGIGARGFVGAEYFILPKFSIGGEFGLGLFLQTTGSSFTAEESVGTVNGNPELGVVEREGGSATNFGFDADSNNTVFGPAGTLRLTFHF